MRYFLGSVCANPFSAWFSSSFFPFFYNITLKVKRLEFCSLNKPRLRDGFFLPIIYNSFPSLSTLYFHQLRHIFCTSAVFYNIFCTDLCPDPIVKSVFILLFIRSTLKSALFFAVSSTDHSMCRNVHIKILHSRLVFSNSPFDVIARQHDVSDLSSLDCSHYQLRRLSTYLCDRSVYA